uniref:Uncharacterized protein n=1 Tax=Phlebotomus papatasi TaxID=29031 RepID=A0A1B0D116_PHLPP
MLSQSKSYTMSLGRLSVIILVTLLHWVAPSHADANSAGIVTESVVKSENSSMITMRGDTLNQLGNMLLDLADDSLSRGHIDVLPGVTIERNLSVSHSETRSYGSVQKRLHDFVESCVINVDVGRALGTGRIFFFKGLKKMMWPLFIGLQVVKTALLALFLPSLIGSLGKIVGKATARELNELKKPTSDNPDIMRFFKYMKAAKDGQDGVNCDVMNRDCVDLKDNTSPAMITTFNDINKLVHARKLH